MKKRTACFGWTKRLQRLSARAANLHRRGLHDAAASLMADVKNAHRDRVSQLMGASP